jgi:predicted secreted protein
VPSCNIRHAEVSIDSSLLCDSIFRLQHHLRHVVRGCTLDVCPRDVTVEVLLSNAKRTCHQSHVLFTFRNTTSSRVRLAFIIIYWVAFIVYMPIGLSISFASDDCYVVKPSGDYDYSACASIHIVRIISQYFAIIFSLLLVSRHTLLLSYTLKRATRRLVHWRLI